MIYYKKEGRKYIPVKDTKAYEGLEDGCWLVKVERGCTSIRKCIEPSFAPLQFATLIAQNKICDFLLKASEAKPKFMRYTKAQQKIIDQINNLPLKDRILHFEYESYHGMAEKIVDLILENYEKSKQ